MRAGLPDNLHRDDCEPARLPQPEAGDDDVLRKVEGDLDAQGVPETEAAIRAKMTELLAQAVAEIQSGR